jgi:pyruvyltransferase
VRETGRHRPSSFEAAADLVLVDGAIPLTWWTYAPNIGDLLSPYLVRAMTGLPVKLIDNYPKVPGVGHRIASELRPHNRFSYLAIGSIINRAQNRSVVWGSGCFGTEDRRSLNGRATYLAVRGPLTRNLLRIAGIDCPPVYGDPALLMPMVFSAPAVKKYPMGLVLRHSERAWLNTPIGEGIALIDMRSKDVEGALVEMLSCERLIAASLHGLVLADAYGIPSAWLASTTPKGLEFKYYDYFLSVDKVRTAQSVDFGVPSLTLRQLESLSFDDRPIRFDRDRLLEASPFVDAW